jgi:hypothetical protein
MYEDPKSKISQLEKILDEREDRVTKKVKRHELLNREIYANSNWDDKEFEVKDESIELDEKKRGLSVSVKILIGSIIFFLIALAVVAYEFLGGGNIVSGNNIDISVRAPISIAGGELLPFEIEIRNNNSVKLSGADLGVTFPVGARLATDTSLPAKRVQEFIGDIAPGQTVKKNLSVVLFGTENEKKEIGITLEYKIAGSNSQFNKNKAVSVLLASAPVSIVVTGSKEVNTNQVVNLNVDITSNSPTILKGVLLKADYPFGFNFTKSEPNFFSKNNVWLIGDLAPGEKRTIKISGTLNGQEGEERGFNFSVGLQSKADNLAIDSAFTSAFSSVIIRRPFVSADMFFNDQYTSDYIASAGGKVEVVIKWQNNLPYQVSDVAIVVKLSGNAVDKSSVQVEDGFYRSIDNTITFDKNTNVSLKLLGPGDSGESKFELKSFSAGSVTGSGLSNPVITLNLSVKGRRVDYGGSPEDVLFSAVNRIKVTSDPQLFAKSLYYVGPFQNTGPVPPKAEKETTYTITWTVTNPLNNLSGAKVSAVLPPYVKWLNVISPDKEKISYNEDTRELTWNLGNVLAGAGRIVPAREVSFQLSFLPSVSQIDSSPDLIGAARLEARDTFTSTTVADSFTAVNTRLSNDPYFRADFENVIK